MISAMFMNAGNFGMPVTLFAFGEDALAFASVFFVTNLLLVNTLGVFIASLGRATLAQAALNLLKLPALYGLILAVIFMMTGWEVPLPLARTTKLLGDASIPTLMVLLGVQFHSIRLKGNLAPLATGSAIRLLVSPTIMLGISALFGLQGALRQAVVLESAMPSAVLNTVLATQYDADPPYVAGVVAITTLLSPLVLTPLLAYLGA
jgi:predicted permease